MSPGEQARLLAAKADEDIHVLAALRDDRGTSDAVWGFHAQQAVEKLLKSRLAFHGLRFPFTHRLLELADLLEDAMHPVEQEFDPLLDLTPYAVEFRYSALPASSSEPPIDRSAVLTLVKTMRSAVHAQVGG